MASLEYVWAKWQSGGANQALLPGESREWSVQGFGYRQVVAVTVWPTRGRTSARRILAVENLRTESDSHYYTLTFSVRNVGQSEVPSYTLNFALVDE
jgi:hypothetical protein